VLTVGGGVRDKKKHKLEWDKSGENKKRQSCRTAEGKYLNQVGKKRESGE